MVRYFSVSLILLMAACGRAASVDEAGSDDIAELNHLHHVLLQAHLDGTVEPWMAMEGEYYVAASQGEVRFRSVEERRSGRTQYLEGTTYTTYRDLIDPIVTVSGDGSLGWIISQIEAIGVAETDSGTVPLEFVAAVIELYRKEDGEWKRIGDVFNTR